jgi:hypothetical protein
MTTKNLWLSARIMHREDKLTGRIVSRFNQPAASMIVLKCIQSAALALPPCTREIMTGGVEARMTVERIIWSRRVR